MSSVAVAPLIQPASPTGRRLIASGKITPRRVIPTPRATSTTCVWCGHAIYATDLTERIGLAELHRFPCVEQFEMHAYDEEGSQ